MKLSVLMITYNHERYIRDALDSVLVQDVDFDYEIVVGEDCSQDSTRQILLEYQANHPDKIRLLLRDNNIGAVPNFFDTLRACRGKYIALLEGDDYWTDPAKLRKQVHFLDASPDYVMCFHNARGVAEDASEPDFMYCRGYVKPTLEFPDLLPDNFVPTCSVVFRRKAVPHYPDWLLSLKMGDYPLHLLNAQYGKVRYLDESMAVYRFHRRGLSHHLDWTNWVHANVAMLERLADTVKPQYRLPVQAALARKYWQLAGQYEARGQLRLARQYVVRSLRARLRTGSPTVRHKLWTLLRFSVPWLGWLWKRVHRALRSPPVTHRAALRLSAEPRISVILPAYNAQRYLRGALDSVLDQTYTDFELLVVDDGSTDRSSQIILDAARRDPRVRPVNVPHGGIVRALNAGFREARGQFIARMDADDLCLPQRLEKQIAFLGQNPNCVAVGSKVLLVDPYGSPLWEMDVPPEHEKIEAELLKANGWALFHPTALIRREALSAIDGYREEYQWSEDIDVFLRLGEVGRLANLTDVLLHYRQHFGSVNRTRAEEQVKINEKLLAEAYRRRGLSAPERFALKPSPHPRLDEQLLAWGRRAMINRNFSVARRHAWAAVRVAPFRSEAWKLVYHSTVGR